MFHNKVDEILDKMSWETLGLEEKYKALQSSLIQAGEEVFGTRSKGGTAWKPRLVKRHTKLKASKKEWERRAKFRALQMARMKAARVVVPRRLQAQGVYCTTTAKEVKEQLDELQNKEIISKRQRTQRIIKLGSAGFWRLVRRVIRQSSRITAVEDNGCLVMDKALIEKIVLQELGKIFKRKTSQIFLSKESSC